MDLELSEEQEQLRWQARRALTEHCDYSDLRRMITEDVSHDENLWRQAAELGWLGVTIPEQYGGLDLSAEELCVLSEEMGRVLAPIPFSSSICLAAEAIRLYGSSAQRERYLPAMARGEVIGALALAEGPEWELNSPATRASGGEVSGRKLPVADGTIADLLVVSAQDDAGDLQLLLVATDQSGVRRRRVNVIDQLRHHAVVDLTGAQAEPLAVNGEAAAALTRILQGAAVYTAFEQIGGADVCLEMARDYSLERKTFGRVIGSYQGLKHRMADMYAKNELARSNAYGAAWALAGERDDLVLYAGAARTSANEAFRFAATENLQIHGGIGYTFEADCHFYYRRARLLGVSLGNSAAWARPVVEALVRAEVDGS